MIPSATMSIWQDVTRAGVRLTCTLVLAASACADLSPDGESSLEDHAHAVDDSVAVRSTGLHISCEGLRCESLARRFEHNIDETVQWDPCDGRSFNYEIQKTIRGRDRIFVGDAEFRGGDSERAAADGPVAVRVVTDGRRRSVLRSITAQCHETMSDWTEAQVERYAETHRSYWATPRGLEMRQAHHMWHRRNGVGGAAGRGSGLAFLGFHRAVVNQLREHAATTNGVAPLSVDVEGWVPNSLPDATDAAETLTALGVETSARPRRTEFLDTEMFLGDRVGVPAWLTLDGVGSNTRWSATKEVDDVGYSRLGDFRDPDALGRAIGGGYHQSAHNWIGGTMASMHSPVDPVFYGWHGFLDNLLEVWLTETDNGRAWMEENPNHPLLVPGFTHIDGWDNVEFAPK